MKGILIVRKYKNRRLYDTERSTHITREELADAIRAGRVVQVQEATTGDDVTVETLFQLFLDEGGEPLQAAIPSEFAHFLIRAGKDELFRFFREFLPQAAQAFQSGWRTVQDQQQRLAEGMFPYGRVPMNPWLAPWGSPPQPAPPAAGEHSQGRSDEVSQLERRLKDLEARLGRMGKK